MKKNSKQEQNIQHLGEGEQKQRDLLTTDGKTVVKKEARYLCGGCGDKVFDRDELRVHMETVHVDEDVRLIGIGCKPCEEGELHLNCDFDKKDQKDFDKKAKVQSNKI